jgi:hypothetical protein
VVGGLRYIIGPTATLVSLLARDEDCDLAAAPALVSRTIISPELISVVLLVLKRDTSLIVHRFLYSAFCAAMLRAGNTA